MNRLAVLVQLLRSRPGSAAECALRRVLIVIGLAALTLTALLYAAHSELSHANARLKIDMVASEFRRMAEPLARRLQTMRRLALDEGVDLCDPANLQKVRTAVVEPLAQVRGVIWADNAGFEQLHLRDPQSEAPWRVLNTEDLPFKSAFASWFQLAREVLEEAGDAAPPIVWCDVTEPFPDDATAMMAAIAWPFEGRQGSTVQVAAFAIDRAAVRAFLTGLAIGEEGEVLAFSEHSPRVLEMSLGRPDVVTWEGRAALIDRTAQEFGEVAADLLRRPAPDSLRRVALHGRHFVCALRPVDVVEESLWIGLAIPEGQLAALRRNQPVLIGALILVLVCGVATIVQVARRADRRLQHLTARPRLGQAEQAEIEALIRGGENDTVEFKSTLRWNLKADRPGKEIAHACLKTIAAFCNSGGGTLLVGVEDDGSILGIAADRLPNEDKYLLHFNNMLKEHIGLARAGAITGTIRDVGPARILVVDCAHSEEAVFVRSGDEQEYFVRLGPATRKLTGDAMLAHIRTRQSS